MGVEGGRMWEDVCHSVIIADDCCGIDQMEKENFLQIEDILEFSNEDIAAPIGEDNSFDICSYKEVRKDPLSGSCSSSSSSTIKSNSSSDLNAVLQSSDLFVPEEDGLGELEWLSNLIEEEPPKWIQTPTHDDNISQFVKTPAFNPENPVPGKARSKRSRTPAYNLSSRVVVSPESSSYENITMSSTVSSDSVDSSKATYTSKFDLIRYESDQNEDFGMRKCTHCLTTRTPQWRTGPKGPKTLCNACGVRFKSGRLVPEYRPASSPTFVPSKHSNSHRKVMEMRRHKHIALFQARSRPRSVAKQEKDVHSPEESGSEVFQYQWFDATDYEECLIPTKQDFRQLIL